jgi:hypothetical protein
MSDKENDRSFFGKPTVSHTSQSPRVSSTFGATMRSKAKQRQVEAENKLGAALLEHQHLQVKLSDAQGEVASAVARNEDLDSIHLKAKMEVRYGLETVEFHLRDLDVRTQKLNAEANEIISKHRSNVADNEASTRGAEARKIDAENAILEGKITKLRNEQRLRQMESETERNALRITLQDKIADIDRLLETAIQRLEALNDPALGEDEMQPFKLKGAQRELSILKAKKTDLQQQLEDVS